MFGTINDLEIDNPSSFSVEDNVIGGFNGTINGNKRMYVKDIKKVWRLTYDRLHLNVFNNIHSESEKEISTGLQTSEVYANFTIYDADFNVTDESVHIDISNRDFSDVDFLENVEITLTQV